MSKKVFVAIDGSNFYHLLISKQVGIKGLLDFDYFGFASWLAGVNRLINCSYYVGQIREEQNNPKSRSMKRDQDRLFAYLKNNKIEVKTGYLLKTNGKYSEKGVDVQIAVDMCMKSVRNECDIIELVSSDTDLIPAIKEVRNLYKQVEYVGLSSSPSFALIRNSNSTRLLKREDLLPFQKIKYD